MKQLSISKVIEFSRKSKKSQRTFLNQHNKPKEQNSNGGNYWAPCMSAVSNAFKYNDNSLISDKIKFLLDEIQRAKHKITKDMYKRNVEILYKFENFNFSNLKTDNQLTFIKKKSKDSVIYINRIPIQVVPNHIFSYDLDGVTHIGAITFVSKLGGYKTNELAAFSDAAYRYLAINYSEESQINTKLCITIDMINLNMISYDDIVRGNADSLLDSTIDEIINAA